VGLAEATAVITPLSRWVFRKGVAQRAAWHRDGINARISLNVSPINLAEPDFADFMLETCREEGVAPELMEIEFTESAQTMDSELTLAQLSRLRNEGVRVAIDDFGSGYSNMRYLRSIPADALKIDKDFILTLDTDEKNRKIVPTIIELGQHLGFAVVAEGIETAASYNTLADWGCDEGQGFFMSKPLAEPVFRDWFHAQRAVAA
jgi:EAL domain-containing protein (putative c-di-GMP-specific phosphodiesterase class I)